LRAERNALYGQNSDPTQYQRTAEHDRRLDHGELRRECLVAKCKLMAMARMPSTLTTPRSMPAVPMPMPAKKQTA
jgi:hypothetical protein